MIISDFFGMIANFILFVINALGYAGVFVMMVLESMVFPAPSELIMPFAGYIAYQGNFNLVFVIVISTIGSITGSLFSYYIGKKWGYNLVESYGKYFLVTHEDLKKTVSWFSRRGEITIFLSRLVPVVRHLISIVAGVGKMDVKKFSLYTIFGAAIWNSLLAYLGFLLGQHWDQVTKYADEISIVVIVLLVVGCLYFAYMHLSKKRNPKKTKQ